MRVVGAVLAGAVVLGLGACGGGDEAAEGSTAGGDAATAAPAGGGGSGGPNLRPGLWKTVTTVPGVGPSSSENCVRSGPEAKPLTGFEGTENCGEVRVTKEGAAWVTRATCAANESTPGGTVESRSTGDFQSSYATELIMRTAGSQGPQGEMRIQMVSTRTGDC